MSTDWASRVAAAVGRLEEDRWTFSAPKYFDVIDDVVAGEFTVDELAKVHGSANMVGTALGHVTTAIQGSGVVKPLADGGWYEKQGERYVVDPHFTAAWKALREGDSEP